MVSRAEQCLPMHVCLGSECSVVGLLSNKLNHGRLRLYKHYFIQ